MQFKNILYHSKNNILYLILNRPDVHNALSPEMWNEMFTAIQCARADTSIRVVILTGAGNKALASGADINEIRERHYLNVLQSIAGNVLTELGNLNKPVICAINGYALGGGCELAMACDLRIATKRSKFGQPELSLGIIPGAGGTQRLSRLIGIGRAKELIFTGRIIDAEEALSIGLVNQITDNNSDVLMAEAEKMAHKILEKAPLAVELAKMSIDMGASTDLQTGLMIERLSETIAFSSEERLEGTTAFLEKRPPHFKGRKS